MKYAVMATDNNPNYQNLVPICAGGWQRLGWAPLVICCNTGAKPPCAANFIHMNDPRIKSSRVAMISRFVVANHDPSLHSQDILLTTDADALILQAPWMDEALEYAKQGYLVSIAHDWKKYNIIAAWYIMGMVATWQQVIPYSLSEVITQHLPELLSDEGYSFDERWLKRDIFSKHSEKFKFIVRDNKDRIHSQHLKDICDIHLHLWKERVFDL